MSSPTSPPPAQEGNLPSWLWPGSESSDSFEVETECEHKKGEEQVVRGQRRAELEAVFEGCRKSLAYSGDDIESEFDITIQVNNIFVNDVEVLDETTLKNANCIFERVQAEIMMKKTHRVDGRYSHKKFGELLTSRWTYILRSKPCNYLVSCVRIVPAASLLIVISVKYNPAPLLTKRGRTLDGQSQYDPISKIAKSLVAGDQTGERQQMTSMSEGIRGKAIELLVDLIKAKPGENQLEFEPQSTRQILQNELTTSKKVAAELRRQVQALQDQLTRSQNSANIEKQRLANIIGALNITIRNQKEDYETYLKAEKFANDSRVERLSERVSELEKQKQSLEKDLQQHREQRKISTDIASSLLQRCLSDVGKYCVDQLSENPSRTDFENIVDRVLRERHFEIIDEGFEYLSMKVESIIQEEKLAILMRGYT